MKWKVSFFALFCAIALCGAADTDTNPFLHKRVLDPNGKYVLQYLADFDESRIYFNLSVETTGYVGFGLSRNGVMLGADLVIGGVFRNGSSYFSDLHGTVNHQVQVDASQDYTLHEARESSTHTFLSFSRPFETCDGNDTAINNDRLAVLWSYGELDNDREYHYQNRGAVSLYLLDPDLTPRAVQELSYANVSSTQPAKSLGDWKVWSIPTKIDILEQETEYLCTFHKTPEKSKHHIVGFRTVAGELEKKHIRKLSLHACHAPKGVDAHVLFGRYVGQPGEECYVLNNPQNRIPTQYCQEIKHVWGSGAEAYALPEHVGIPMSQYADEYFMMQVHYDNPQRQAGIRLQFSLELFYTSKLRQYDAGLMSTGVTSPDALSIVVPPSDTNHIIYGHCSANCTRKIIPESGVHIFAGALRTHSTGKGVRSLLIQNLQEYAMLADDNYNFNHQPVRILREERTLLPGDMIVDRCIYDSRNRTGATVGGLRAEDEICSVILWYYPLIRGDIFGQCTGELRSDPYRNDLGIHQTTWSDERRAEIVTAPPKSAGLTATEALSNINWDINKRVQLQSHHRFLPQVSECPSFSPDAVTKKLLGQIRPNTTPLRRYLEIVETRDTGLLTNINKEIRDPENEFVSLWPKDLQFYSPPTICPKP